MKMPDKEKFYATMASLQSHAMKAACPIYAIDDDVGFLTGSGFLLDVAGETLLVTAAHVFYVRHEHPLYLPGEGKPVSFGGQAFYTGPKVKVQYPNFGYDFACIRLKPESVAASTGCLRLTPDDLDVSDVPGPQTLYGFAGFPGDANETLPYYKLPRNAHYYGGQPATPDTYQQLAYNIETHFVMTFDHNAMVDDKGKVMPVPEPFGMSGGPVWRLGSFQELETGSAKPRVIGVTVTWSEQLHVLSAVRIALIVAALRDALPHLASSLPTPKYVGANVSIK